MPTALARLCAAYPGGQTAVAAALGVHRSLVTFATRPGRTSLTVAHLERLAAIVADQHPALSTPTLRGDLLADRATRPSHRLIEIPVDDSTPLAIAVGHATAANRTNEADLRAALTSILKT